MELRMSRRSAVVRLAGVVSAAALGRSSRGATSRAKSVTVYTALDREFSQPILRAYEKSAGVTVAAKYDVESTKTVGLTQEIMAEAGRPRCDLFWNNEILNTIRLKKRGLLATFRPKNADDFPAEFRDKAGAWYGFAARARVLIVNTKLVARADRPTGVRDLLDPKWKGQIGFAKPLFGTTATHAACLFAAWGDARAKAFFRDLKANGAKVLSGNKQVATSVGAGQLAFGLTDTDDAMGEVDAGNPVVIVYPDRKPDQLGTLFLPNTLAVIKGAPHTEEAEALANHLLSREVEIALANGPSAQIPLNRRVDVKLKVETPKTVHAMAPDFEAAAKDWEKVAAFLAKEFSSS